MSGRITALVIQKRNKDRVNVFIEGEFAFGLTLNEALHLKKGQLLSDKEIDDLKSRDAVETAHESALHYLSYRARTIAEMRHNLADKGFSEAISETVIARLCEVGLLDDAAFAQQWVMERDRSDPRGRLAMRYELRQKGISDQIIDPALESVDEEDAALRAALPRLEHMNRLDETACRKQVLAYLQRRGFPYSIARDAFIHAWQTTIENELDIPQDTEREGPK